MAWKDKAAKNIYQRMWAKERPPRDRREYMAKWRAENVDKIRTQARTWVTKNLDKIAKYDAKAKERYKIDDICRSKVLAQQATYRKKKRETRTKKRIKPSPDTVRGRRVGYQTKRRARISGSGGSHTLAQRRAKFELHGNRCFYCGCGGKITVDHNLPICRGGSDNISNILPACKSCNSRKQRLTAAEFLEKIEQAKS